MADDNQTSRRKFLTGGAGIAAVASAGCLNNLPSNPVTAQKSTPQSEKPTFNSTDSETETSESTTMEEQPKEYTYINETTNLLIGEKTEISGGIQINLTEFAVSKHSAANEILLLSDTSVSKNTIVNRVMMPDEQTIVVPVSVEQVKSIAVVDDELNELEMKTQA